MNFQTSSVFKKSLPGRKVRPYSLDSSFPYSHETMTTEAKGVVKDIHERMPVILEREGYKKWLDPMVQTRDRLNIRQIKNSYLVAWPVTHQINNPNNNSVELVKSIGNNNAD